MSCFLTFHRIYFFPSHFLVVSARKLPHHLVSSCPGRHASAPGPLMSEETNTYGFRRKKTCADIRPWHQKRHSCFSYASKISDLNSTRICTLDILTLGQMVFYSAFLHCGHQKPHGALIRLVRDSTVSGKSYAETIFVMITATGSCLSWAESKQLPLDTLRGQFLCKHVYGEHLPLNVPQYAHSRFYPLL